MPAIKPNEVMPSVAARIPEYVIEAFNELIRAKFTGYSATVTLEDAKQAVARAIVQNNPEVPYQSIDSARKFADENRYLEVETIFRDAGWKVEYNHQSYGDSYASHYVFSMPR
jgi:hypothetical protein